MVAVVERIPESALTMRRAQTRREIVRLEEDFATWRERRSKADERGKYVTQLTRVASEVKGALAAVRTEFGKIGAAGSSGGQQYEALARVDRQLIWARYAWDFFRTRFDQRDDIELGKVLRAADEVMWSCFKPPFEGSVSVPAAPLPCIELDYAASTVLSRQAHVIRKLDKSDGAPLAEYFDSLPIPLLKLPPSVVSSPWMLAVIGHEAGHSVYENLSSAGHFALNPEKFEALVDKACGEVDPTGNSSNRWVPWSTEIFADWYALLMMGPAALWSLAQLDFGAPENMALQRRFYPPARVRLLLLWSMARNMGFTSLDAWLAPFGISALQLQQLAAESSDGAIALRVAAIAARGAGTPGAALAGAVSYHHEDFEPVKGKPTSAVVQWAKMLRGEIDRHPENELRTARLVAAGAVAAARGLYADVLEPEDPSPKSDADKQRKQQFEDLSANCKSLLEDSAEDGKRGLYDREIVASDGLARLLLDATDKQLFALEGGESK